MKRHPWFIKVRGSYLPNSWQGWLSYIPYTAYTLAVVAYAVVHQYGKWQAVFLVFPNWVAALVIMTWVAEHTSRS